VSAALATLLAFAPAVGATVPSNDAVGAASDGVTVTANDGRTEVVFALAQPAFWCAREDSIHPALAPRFTATLRSQLLVERAGRFRFFLVASGGAARVRIGGEGVAEVAAERAAGGDEAREGSALELAAGMVPIEVEFARDAGPALLRREWSSDTFAREPIPARLFRDAPAVPERSAAIERGRLLAEERGCFACHAAETRRRGPDLTRVGERTSFEWLDRWLADPRAVRVGATMPALPLSPRSAATSPRSSRR